MCLNFVRYYNDFLMIKITIVMAYSGLCVSPKTLLYSGTYPNVACLVDETHLATQEMLCLQAETERDATLSRYPNNLED